MRGASREIEAVKRTIRYIIPDQIISDNSVIVSAANYICSQQPTILFLKANATPVLYNDLKNKLRIK